MGLVRQPLVRECASIDSQRRGRAGLRWREGEGVGGGEGGLVETWNFMWDGQAELKRWSARGSRGFQVF